MSRIYSIGNSTGGLLFVFLHLSLALPLHAADAEKPNLVVILADDLGYGDVQCLNPERGKIATPNLDRLAAQGMTLLDAHSGSSVCTPTRYGLLTGRYAWRTRLQRGVLDGGNDEPLIAAQRLTLPAMLKQHGYHSACIGKWHLGFIAKAPEGFDEKEVSSKKAQSGAPVGHVIQGGPITRGFDYFFGCSNARTMASLIENDRVVEQIEHVDMLPRIGQRAVEYIEQRATTAKAGQPFFLYLPLTSPHTPIVPAQPWRGKSGLGSYGDFVMQTDAVVGEVLAALEKNGLGDNTLVVFSADNGCSPQAGIEKLESRGHFASAQFRGYKADIWDGGHRVPFLVRWPNRIKAGSQSEQLVCLTDLMATAAEIVGEKLPDAAGEDSVSLLSTLLGKDAVAVREAIVHHSIQGKFAIRQGRWKLCLCAGSGGWSQGGDGQSPQLYDMTADPSETRNLAKKHPQVVAQLRAMLKKQVAEGRSTPGLRQTNDVQVDIEK